MVAHYLLITLSLKCETTCSSGIGRLFPRVIRIVMVTTLSRNGIVCLTCKAVECILMNNYTNPLGKKDSSLSLHHLGRLFLFVFMGSLFLPL